MMELWESGAPDSVLSIGQIEQTVFLLFEIKLFICTKMDLAVNYRQWLICYKIQPKQILYIGYISIKRIWH